MMAAKFKVKFAKGASTIEVPGPPKETQIAAPAVFVTGSTVGGVRFGYKASGSVRELWTVPLEALNGTQKQALQTFFYTTVGGPGVTFTYTHTDEQSYTAQFVGPGLQWRRQNAEMWDCSVVLEVTTQVK